MYCENSKYLERVFDTSVITCDGKYYSNKCYGSSTASINCNSKKVRYKTNSYILHIVLLVIVLILIITIICYHYAKHRSKQKDIDALAI